MVVATDATAADLPVAAEAEDEEESLLKLAPVFFSPNVDLFKCLSKENIETGRNLSRHTYRVFVTCYNSLNEVLLALNPFNLS